MPAVSPIFVFEIHYGLVEGCRVIVSNVSIFFFTSYSFLVITLFVI